MIKLTDYLIKRLVEHDIKHIFMIAGGGAMHINDSVGKNKNISYICNHHEQACAIAAEGYSRTTGKLAVVSVTSGPGGTNTLTGVISQWLDSVPVLYISGQIKLETCIANYNIPGLRQIGDQEINIIDIVKPVTKFAAIVKNPLEIKLLLDKAINIATTGRPGPVWLDIPLDIQAALINEEDLLEYNSKEDEILLDPNDLDKNIIELIKFLKLSQRPVIVAGNGIRISDSKDLFLKLIEKIKIPVVTSFNGFDLIPTSHPLFIGRFGTIGDRSGNFAVQNSDLFISIGSRNNIRQISYNGQSVARGAKKVVIDIDIAELQKPTFRPDLTVHSDAKIFLEKLLLKINNLTLPDYSQWLEWCNVRKKRYPVVLKEYKKIKNNVHPYYFIEKLSEYLPENSIIVTANGSACVVYFQAGIVKKDQRVFWNSGCASMGYDLPAAIGASIANPGKDIICLAGDGSIMMNIQELETISFNKLPVKIFILNNNGYISIRQTQESFFNGRLIGCDSNTGLGFPEFSKISKAFNIPFKTIKSHKNMSKRIIDILDTPGPIIVDVKLLCDYKFSPKLSSEKKPDGRIISKPLEDMYPFLDRDEFQKNMIVDTVNI